MDEHQLFLQRKFGEVAKLIQQQINKNQLNSKNQEIKILDIGCNNGQIKNFLPINIKYFGVDINKQLIQQLQQKGIKAKQADLNKQEIPFQFERFDYILMLDIIEHVINPKKLLLQAKQKLNQRGKLIITLPNDYHILNKIRFVFNKQITEDPFSPFGHLHYFPIKTGEQFLKNNQLKILKKIPIPPIKPLILPSAIKNFLSNKMPQSFARDILYLLEPVNNPDFAT